MPPGRSGTPENSRPGRYARDGNPCRIDAVSGRCAPAWCKNANMINSGEYFVAVM
ncbi:hypothetical protein ACLBPW_17630 [Klebsiella pneumoniae]|uniref:hypothetical protein n=1 Tax=Klebsiella pneumoniae TaxID=573 RepID=UPI003969A6EF